MRKTTFCSVPGVGEQLNDLPELGTLNRPRTETAVPVGANLVSGAAQRCSTWVRWSPVDTIRCSDLLSTFARQGSLRRLTACMRKLLTILNAMVKAGQHWTHQVNSP